MKQSLKSALAALGLVGLTASGLHAQAIDPTFNANDVLFGFRAASGTGATTTIVFNLGSATNYRDAVSNSINFANIGTLLTNTYGIGAGNGVEWHERTDLWAGFVSATNGNPVDNAPAGPIASQTTDYNSTIYVSTRRTATGTLGNANSTRPGNSIALDATAAGGQINTFGGVFDSNDGGTGIASLTTSTTNGWSSYVTGSAAVDFGSFNIEAAFTVGNRGTFGAAGTVEQIWDFYRVAQFPVSDLDSGKGLYQGSFSINNSGQLSFVAIPEPSTIGLIILGGLTTLVSRRRRKQTAVA